MANDSPLSRWAGQPVVKQLRFQLTLDDPKLPEEQWLTLRGDRAQLEALHEAVSMYVQAFLEQSQSYGKTTAVSPISTTIAPLPVAATDTALKTAPLDSKEISLRPRGLLTHDLVLGTLATPEAASVVPLSALQLFDLANALDEYASDLVALPLQRSRQVAPSSLRWGQLAAAGLVVIGLSASVAKIIDSSRKPASPTASQGASSDSLAPQPPAVVSPLPPIASNQKLPPPPPIGSTVPGSPGLPTFPLSSPASSPKTGSSPGAIPQPSLNRPGLPRKDASNQIAMLPQKGSPALRARSQPAAPPSLALNREFAGAPLSQTRSAESRSAASDRSSQAEQAGTAFDTIPQVAEARQYFQQRWTPPQGLTQTLEYTLVVGANGSIQRTVPLGQAAGDYVDRTGMPLTGEPFVSAIKSGRNPKIRLVLSPDGTVKTFLEGYF
jgi:hypothetical protein